jgi:hypothetical protein
MKNTAMIEKNGFTVAGHTSDTQNTVYHRVWTKAGSTMEIRMMVCGSAVLASVRKNGHDDPEFIRDYSSVQTALAVFKDIVVRAGYEW